MVVVNKTKIMLKLGDITSEECDAIVNAANNSLMGGGGVDGAIHRIGGPLVYEDCATISKDQGGCLTGEAVVTRAGQLPARLLVHAVGPIWRGGGESEDELLRSAYLNSLRVAAQAGARTIAFPSISTGAYRFPLQRAAAISLRAICDYARAHDSFHEVRLILFTEPDLEAYEQALAEWIATQF